MMIKPNWSHHCFPKDKGCRRSWPLFKSQLMLMRHHHVGCCWPATADGTCSSAVEGTWGWSLSHTRKWSRSNWNPWSWCHYHFIGFWVPTAKSLQLSPTLCHPTDGSQLGSSVPGILQARILEWVAISFSNAWKWKVKVKSLSRSQLLATPWTAAHQASSVHGIFQARVLEWVASAFSSGYLLGLLKSKHHISGMYATPGAKSAQHSCPKLNPGPQC